MSADQTTSPVLVTGATGFIGREVVRRLLALDRSVVAMARGRQGRSAGARVASAVRHRPDGRRLDVIEADLTRPASGLDESQWQRLRETVETVIHCAGDTVFFPDDMGRFRAVHVDGPLDLLHRLRGGRLRRWGHLSTAYVCGRRVGLVCEGEGHLGQAFHNPYERVKLEAEMAMRAAGGHLGIDVRVFRPSVVVGPAPATAGGQAWHAFSTFLQTLAALARLPQIANARLRIAAAPRARFNIVPVEYVARAIVALADHPEGAGQIFHLVVSDAPTQATMLAMIADYFGLRGLAITEARGTALDNPSALERRVARLASAYREYLTQDCYFDDRGARALLDRLGIPRPTLGPEDVHRIIEQALMSPAPQCSPSQETLCQLPAGT